MEKPHGQNYCRVIRMKYHEPVMLAEVLDFLQVSEGKRYIDCTLGDGGHTLEILRLGGRVLGLDVFEESLQRAEKRIVDEGFSDRFLGINKNFKNLEEIAKQNGFGQIDGVLFDLGYSSFQLDDTDIGLSFQREEPLDMRLDDDLGVTAADLVNKLPQKQLEQIIRSFGGENLAKRISTEIVKARDVKKFQTTKDLADLLVSVTPSNYENGRINPATRTFQALRIAVNDEIDNFKLALPQAARVLLPGGRMVLITFHSLEDKVAKEFGTSVQPSLKGVTKKPVVPTEEEVKRNSRSRSAKIRVYERI